MGHRSLNLSRLAFDLGVLYKNAIPEQENSIQWQVFTTRGNQTGVQPEALNLLFKRNRLFRFISGKITAEKNKQEVEDKRFG